MQSLSVETHSATIPPGETIPQFNEKPISVTAQEGKEAVFKVKVKGNPKPSVTWKRASNKPLREGARISFDNVTKENILKVKSNLTADDEDAYKCIASNVHADCTYTVSLSVTESESAPAPREERKVPDEKEMWEILVKADKKDYERICIEYGFTDFRGMLKRLKEMKKKVDTEVSHPPASLPLPSHVWLLSLQGAEPIRTQFSLGKYELKQVGTKYQLVVKNVSMKDSGMYSLQVADKRMSALKPVTVTERQTGVFECKLTKRVDGVLWRWNGAELKRDEKHDITVSEDGLTHTLKVKDVRPSDLGLYSVCVGDKTSSGQMLIDSTSLNPSLTPSLSAPKFITPLRNHNAQRGRDCTMSCAVSGNPRPHITWYKGKVNLSDKLKYWHTSSTGVCTLTVPSATTKDTDDYTIVAENTLGKVTSTCRLTEQAHHVNSD
uniref:Immunoglobulin superfamily member 22 n=1 Tax=Callorhinchus milii TaxID=7868 RepID=A0A4W3GTL1_CALMI